MRLKLVGIFILSLAVIMSSCSHLKAYGGEMKVSKEVAMQIANKEAANLGYNIASLNLKVSKYNTPWNEYLPKESKAEYYTERKKKLANREYWAVYYYPKQDKNNVVKGGDFCIFVDANSGEIITNARWK